MLNKIKREAHLLSLNMPSRKVCDPVSRATSRAGIYLLETMPRSDLGALP